MALDIKEALAKEDMREVDEDFRLLENSTTKAFKEQSVLIEKVKDAVNNISFDTLANEKQSKVESAMNMVNTLNGLIKDRSSGVERTLNMKLKQKSDESEENHREQMRAFAIELATGDLITPEKHKGNNEELPTDEDVEKALENRLNAENIEVSEEECRTDSEDLS